MKRSDLRIFGISQFGDLMARRRTNWLVIDDDMLGQFRSGCRNSVIAGMMARLPRPSPARPVRGRGRAGPTMNGIGQRETQLVGKRRRHLARDHSMKLRLSGAPGPGSRMPTRKRAKVLQVHLQCFADGAAVNECEVC